MSTKLNENWKEVPNSDGRYEVSDIGRVRSYLKQIKGKFVLMDTPQRQIRLCSDKNGYMMCSLWLKGKRISVKTHRLVLETFVGPCPKGMECCHRNSTKSDNRLANLSWDTHRKNMVRDGGAKHIAKKGEDNPNASLTEQKVKSLKMFYKLNPALTHQAIADKFCINRRNVSRILQGVRWNHIDV